MLLLLGTSTDELVRTLVRTSVLGLATGSLSMLLARSRAFREVRWWLARKRRYWPHELVWDGAKCPWCLSVWFAGAAAWLYGPVIHSNHPFIDWAVTALVMVAVAPLAALSIYQSYGHLPPVPTEQEWKDGAE